VTVYARQGVPDPLAGGELILVTPRFEAPRHRHVHFAHAVAKKLRERRYDCILANTPFYPCQVHRAGGGLNAFWYRLKVRELGWRYWVTRQLPKYRSALTLERRIYDPAQVGHQIANSQMVKDQIIAHYHFPSQRVHRIANGIDFNYFDGDWCRRERKNQRQAMGVSDQDLFILCVTNNFRRKGVGTIIDALSRARTRAHVKLMVVGRGKPLERHPQVRFHGHQQNIRPYYAAADCLVLPTLYEPCSNSVLEAMACGVVPVTTPTNGASEFIRQGRNGYILESWRDAQGLAEILDQLQAHPQQRNEIAAEARASVGHLTLAGNAAQVLDVCRTAARGKAAPAEDHS
jgi:UDP-glucose:(heptosyl)LPS alpha-1,3-glucosyltransferase